jgi:hypothetical protein
MTRHLVAADADQIQNLLFRSSHLREVIGGSMMLSQFCKEETNPALAKVIADFHGKVIINDGGSFRLDFGSDKEAKDFLENLADLFREEIGGTLTVAGPLGYEGNEFKTKNPELQLKLLNAKYSHTGAEAEPQLPISAFCASCGIGLAHRYDRPIEEKTEEEKTYLCNYCREKARKNLGKPFFYEDYREAIKVKYPTRFASLEGYLSNPMDPAELIGSLDATQYVGYVLADVNGMGKRFNECKSPKELTDLSKDLTSALWASLAAPIPDLIDRLKERDKLKALENRMPIVPLILGGDDVLALVPARYALDIGCRIGQAFEEEAKQRALNVTIGVAVIICQKHYPYTLAYERGHELLQQAKKHGKSQNLSALNFEVILGNELKTSMADKAMKKKAFRSTLKPYWIGSRAKSNSQEIENAGIHFDMLLEQRLKLKDIPKKRLHELRRFFDQEQAGKLSQNEELPKWKKNFGEFRNRVKSEKWAVQLDKALEALGIAANNNWRSVLRRRQEGPYSAHGMLDLIEAWDYAYKLDEKDKDYQPKES